MKLKRRSDENTVKARAVRRRLEVDADNVLYDLGIEDAEELSVKVRLAVEVNRLVKVREWTQSYCARVLGITQPQVSDIANYKLDHVSTDRLLGFLRRLDVDVEIVMRERSSDIPGDGTLSVRRVA